jgi:hypothetical protein
MSMSKLERLLTAVQLKMPDIVPVSPRGTFNRSQVLKRKTLKTISEKPSIPFNEVSRKVGVERDLLACRLGVKGAGIIGIDYQRRSKETSKLTQKGEELLQVFTKVEPNRHWASRTKKLSRSRGMPKMKYFLRFSSFV